jgi:hypothetical protein
MKQLKASATEFRNKVIELKDFILHEVRVMSNDTKKIGLKG